jgi:PAS domain S-box-containing protein
MAGTVPAPALIFSIWISGFAGAVAIGCLVLWLSRERRQWLGWMALMAAAHAALAACNLLRNSSSDLDTGDIAIRGVGATSLLAAIAILGLYRALCQVEPRWPDRLLTALLLISIPFSLLSPGGASFAAVTSITTMPAGWWGPISQLHGEPDPLLPCVQSLFVLVVLRGVWITLSQRHRIDAVSTSLLLLVAAVLMVPIIHGFGLARGWWSGVPLPEYALSTVFILLGVETRRREREQQRQERDRAAQLEAILGHGLGFAGLLTPDGRLVLANRVALQAVGTTHAAVVGLPFAETPWWLHSPAAQERLRAAIPTVAAGTAERFLTTFPRREGGEHDIDFSLTPYRNESGAVQYLIAEARDISELRRFERQLREGSRLEAIGQLAGGIAHDFNNVLAGIMGAAELALRRTSEPDLRQRLETILSAAGKAGDLTKRLLSYARKAKNANLPLSVNALCTETLELLTRVVGPTIRIERALGARPDSTTGDPAELQSALLNLCVNARDALPQGGVIRVATSRATMAAGLSECRGQSVTPGDYIRIDVTDSGTGIPADVLPRIFEPFFTTKPEGQGTGLGLPAVLGTAHAHHGWLLVQTEPGHGTTMSLLLPAVAGDLSSGSIPVVPNLTGGGLVVLVDDEAQLREQATEMLTLLGLRVESFADSEAAQKRLEHLSGVSCLLLDLAMPKIDGRDLYRRARTLAPDLPVIISSGYAGGGRIIGGAADPRLVFLPKPWRLAQLRDALCKLGVLTPAP